VDAANLVAIFDPPRHLDTPGPGSGSGPEFRFRSRIPAPAPVPSSGSGHEFRLRPRSRVPVPVPVSGSGPEFRFRSRVPVPVPVPSSGSGPEFRFRSRSPAPAAGWTRARTSNCSRCDGKPTRIEIPMRLERPRSSKSETDRFFRVPAAGTTAGAPPEVTTAARHPTSRGANRPTPPRGAPPRLR